MFQIPLKIGKNNELIDNSSDFGENTDRGASISERSYGTTGDSIFEGGYMGSNHNRRSNRRSIIDINELESKERLPLELLGETGLPDFDVKLNQL